MLSRRSVRIKVMQLLYSINRDSDVNLEKAIKQYWKDINASYELFLFNLYTILQISKVAYEDEDKRKAFHEVAVMMKRRIDIMRSLPLASLDRLAIQKQVRDIANQ